MTSRMELLDLIGQTLSERLGSEKVTRRGDGVIVVAGSSEAFLVQAIVVDAPEGTDALAFGKGLVDFIQSGGSAAVDGEVASDAATDDGDVFYSSQNGDQWRLVTDTGGRRFVRHVPNTASGGAVELTDVQSFREREPHSAQNQALERFLR